MATPTTQSAQPNLRRLSLCSAPATPRTASAPTLDEHHALPSSPSPSCPRQTPTLVSPSLQTFAARNSRGSTAHLPKDTTVFTSEAPPSSSSLLTRSQQRPATHIRRQSSISYNHSPTVSSLASSPRSDNRRRRSVMMESPSFVATTTDDSISNRWPSARGSPLSKNVSKVSNSRPASLIASISLPGTSSRLSLDSSRRSLDDQSTTSSGSRPDPAVDDSDIREYLNKPLDDQTTRQGATLLEQHTDLLAFIARKERVCLDIKKELAKHEADLKELRRRWQQVSTRDRTGTPRKSEENNGSESDGHVPFLNRTFGRRSKAHTVSSPSEPGSATSASGAQLLNIADISGDALIGTDAASASYDNARKWMNGIVKSGLGIIENLNTTPSKESLTPVQEEFDDTENDSSIDKSKQSINTYDPFSNDPPTSANHVQSSSTSSISTAHSTKPTLSTGESRSSVSSVGSFKDDHSKYGASLVEGERTPKLDDPDQDTPPAVPEKDTVSSFPPKPSPVPKAPEKHSRRRSTFDLVGTIGNGLTKRWQDVQNSGAFQQSRQATFNILDSFEKSLADTVTLDPRSPSQTSVDLHTEPDNLQNGAAPARRTTGSSELPSGVGGLFGWGPMRQTKNSKRLSSVAPGTEWEWDPHSKNATKPLDASGISSPASSFSSPRHSRLSFKPNIMDMNNGDEEQTTILEPHPLSASNSKQSKPPSSDTSSVVKSDDEEWTPW